MLPKDFSQQVKTIRDVLVNSEGTVCLGQNPPLGHKSSIWNAEVKKLHIGGNPEFGGV